MAHRSHNPSSAALRNREYRERKKAGIEKVSLEIDVAELNERTGEFSTKETRNQFLQELLEDAISTL